MSMDIINGTKRVRLAYQPQDYQLEIHKSKHRYRVMIAGRRCGKTELALNELITKSGRKPGLYWYVTSSYKSAKSIAWRRLKRLLIDDPAWKYNEIELAAKNEELDVVIELKGADNPFSLLGVGLAGLVMDECAILKEDVWTEVLRPMLMDQSGWVLVISTPKGKNWLYDLYMKGATGVEEEWKSWKHPTSINKYIKSQELEDIKKDMSERLYRQEILAEFLEKDIGVFKGIQKCSIGEEKAPEDGRFYVLGADLAKHEDFTVLTVMDAQRREVVCIERFKDISWKEIKDKIQYLANKYNDAMVLLDSTGVGDPILDDLQMSNISVDGYKFTNDSKYKLIQQLIVAIEQRLITFPNDDILIKELEDFTYEISANNNIIYNAPDGRHDDCVISLALAVWACRSFIHSAQVIERREDEEEAVDRQGHGIEIDTDDSDTMSVIPSNGRY